MAAPPDEPPAENEQPLNPSLIVGRHHANKGADLCNSVLWFNIVVKFTTFGGAWVELNPPSVREGKPNRGIWLALLLITSYNKSTANTRR